LSNDPTAPQLCRCLGVATCIKSYFWAIAVSIGSFARVVVSNVNGGCCFCRRIMSTRSGHVDVNERRLRPIYGQHISTLWQPARNKSYTAAYRV